MTGFVVQGHIYILINNNVASSWCFIIYSLTHFDYPAQENTDQPEKD